MAPTFKSNFIDQRNWFRSKGIDISKPGFYDDAKFLELENDNPLLLNNYASFVLQQPYSDEYLTKSQKKITQIVSTFYQELKRDGRAGACIDASNALSRVFDLEGIWNFIQKGSLTITFPAHSGLEKKYFWSIDFGEFAAAHAWIVAPPFKIIDVTIKQQAYKSNEKLYLPDVVLQEQVQPVKYHISDLVEPNILASYMAHFIGDEKLIVQHLMPELPLFTSFFKPSQFSFAGIDFKYVPTGITASDGPLVNANSLRLNGMSAWELYQKVLKPALSDI